jgi:protein-tyrosine phosphatase
MREVIPDKLWIGNALDARDVPGVLGLGITAIIDLAIEEPPIQFPRDITNCRFPLIDGSGNPPAIMRAAIETTATFIASGTPTLVACGAGMSRSPAIVAAAMATSERITLVDALGKLIAEQPHDVSPSLLAEISDVMPAIGRVSQ